LEKPQDTGQVHVSHLKANKNIENMHVPIKMTDLLAEETGWHLGDGSMNWYNGKGLYQLRGHLVDDRSHYEKVIKPAFKELYGIDVNLREMKSTGVFGFQIWSDESMVGVLSYDRAIDKSPR